MEPEILYEIPIKYDFGEKRAKKNKVVTKKFTIKSPVDLLSSDSVMQKIFLRFLKYATIITHPTFSKWYCNFITDNYFSRLSQLKYFSNDYFFKRKYKIIEHHAEFQQELTFVLPFAYWHFLNGTLSKTISSGNTKELYFFSKNHVETEAKRDCINKTKTYEIPNMTHSNSFSYRKWAKVPLQEHYRNEIFVFQKPTLIIANKYNIEWENDPVNFIDIPLLDKIIVSYKDKYQIIYNRPTSTEIVPDNSEILDLGEYTWLKENHPEVILMSDLFTKHSKHVNNYNHLQLMVYANSSHFISVHGGTAALASYFGGTNLIYSKRGLEHVFNEFNTIFPKLSGAQILHAKKAEDVLSYLRDFF